MQPCNSCCSSPSSDIRAGRRSQPGPAVWILSHLPRPEYLSGRRTVETGASARQAYWYAAPLLHNTGHG